MLNNYKYITVVKNFHTPGLSFSYGLTDQSYYTLPIMLATTLLNAYV